MDDGAIARHGQAISIEASQAIIRTRLNHLSRSQIRQAILFNPDSDLWLIESAQMFIVGLGQRDLSVLEEVGTQIERFIAPVFGGNYLYHKWLVETFHGQFVAVPLPGYDLTHTVEYDEDRQALIVSSSIVDLVEPWYEVEWDEKSRLLQMSFAICRAANLAPQVAYADRRDG